MRLRRLLLLSVAMLLPVLGFAERTHGQQTGPRLIVEDTQEHNFTVVGRMKGRRTPITRAVKRVQDAVVNIHSERTVRPVSSEEFQVIPSQGRVNGMGTGVVIDPRGYIVTNHHVVEDVNVLRIRLNDGTSKDAVVVARDPEIDLALIKIDVNRPLPVMPIGTAIDLMRGETVIAIGNAYGYEHTVSSGVVSAVKRDVRLNKDMFYKQLIQTDASINPGNSGGPLINIHGELVGVNVAIRAGAQCIGFAIPVDHVVRAVAKMLRNRRLAGMYDGFSCDDRLEKRQDGYIRQVVVDNVLPDGPAAIAGLQTGDVITKVGDVAVATAIDVERGLMGRNVGEEIQIAVYRQGRIEFTKLILQAKGERASKLSHVLWSKLGVLVSPVHPEIVRRVSDRLHGGLKIQAIHASRAAAKAGIQQGDILVGLHQWETLSMDNVVFVLEHPELPTFNPVRFYIVREGQVRRGKLSVER